MISNEVTQDLLKKHNKSLQFQIIRAWRRLMESGRIEKFANYKKINEQIKQLHKVTNI